MVIQHNITAMNSNRQLGITTGLQAKSSEKLSSGYKINRAADDAAGLAISEKMRRQIRGLDQASRNIQDGISLVQIADGALAESHDNLQRVNELAVRSANDTLTAEDRSYIQEEVTQLLKEVDRTAESTTFNDSIYPLLGAPIVSQFPPQLSETAITVINNTTTPMKYNDQYYAPGESFVIPNVLRNAAGLSYVEARSDNGTGGGLGFTVSNSFPVNGGENYVIAAASFDTLYEDGEGYLYFTGLWGTRYYQTTNGYETRGPQNDAEASKYLKKDRVMEPVEPLYIQAGSEAGHVIDITLVNATAENLGVDPLDVSTSDSARQSIEKVKSALNKVSQYRSDFGAMQNRLEHAYQNVCNAVENTQDAESQIRDTDMAEEMVRYSNNNILVQAGQSMLAQANQTNQGVLSLLQ